MDHNSHKHHHQTSEGHQKSHDHSAHHRAMIQDFKKRTWLVAILTIPVLLLSPMIQNWVGISSEVPYQSHLLFLLSSMIFFYGGWPFLIGFVRELRKGSPGMMTLIAVAISASYLYSSAVVFGLEGKTFFWESATLILIMLIGHWLEMRSVLGASRALEELAALMPDTAHLLHGDHVMEVKTSELSNGDVVMIKPGEKIPADGKIIEGTSFLNESMLTGESKPVKKTSGQEVIGGSVNGNDMIKVRVEGIGNESYLSKVLEMVRNAQSQKSRTQGLADVAARWLTLIAITLGFGTFVIWMMKGELLSFALERMVTVMVICCPHALGLAIPLVAAISTSLSAERGLLIRNRTAFENTRKIDTIVFDKTGTLTKGSHEVVSIEPVQEGLSENELLLIATAVEVPSEHHISKGLQRKVKESGLVVPSVEGFKYRTGIGVSGIVDGHQIKVGGKLMLEESGLRAPQSESGIETRIYIIKDDQLVGSIAFADEIRESSIEAIKTLQSNGIECSLLTGDNDRVAAAVAKELGMDDYMAEVLPEQKQGKIKELQSRGEFVAMTGDGVNDAPALAQSDVGIAIGSGTDVAAETADIILVDSDPMDIVDLILFGKATHRKMIQNLIWATGYNVVALPLATGFIPGLMISPAVGAILMSVSTVICAVNAQTLRHAFKSV